MDRAASPRDSETGENTPLLGENDAMGRRWSLGNASGQEGQAMVEYLVVTGILLASLAILTFFLVTFKEYGYRVLDMVASDYP